MRSILAIGAMGLGVTVAHGSDMVGEQRGKLLLETHCARCHAIGMAGDSPHKDAPPFRQVMKVYPADSLTEALAEGLVTGHPDMPEFVFSAGDAASIVVYLRTLEP